MPDELDTVAHFEKECGLPPGFYLSLLREDDWSFVIKLHALVEATVSRLLAGTCMRPELLDTFSRLELSNSTTGKLAFAKALGCLEEADRRFIRSLSEIRNDFVHDVRQAGKDLKAYTSGFDANQWNKFRLAFGPGRETIDFGNVTMTELEFVRNNPKAAIWLSGIYVVALAYLRKEEASLEARHAVLRLEAYNRLFRPSSGA
ncbi:MAG TPA: hypothetical protein VGA22_09215 [Gemmatimonadales bacterium]|jgi:hypothetical protein